MGRPSSWTDRVVPSHLGSSSGMLENKSTRSPPKRQQRTDLRSVDKTHPCVTCRGEHKCSTGDDGLIMCGREAGQVPGFVRVGTANGDPPVHPFYRREGEEPETRSSRR